MVSINQLAAQGRSQWRAGGRAPPGTTNYHFVGNVTPDLNNSLNNKLLFRKQRIYWFAINCRKFCLSPPPPPCSDIAAFGPVAAFHLWDGWEISP